MKHLLLTTIAAVLLVGCGESQQSPEPPTAKAPDISIHDAAMDGNIEVLKQAIADGADVNAKNDSGLTPLHFAAWGGHKEIAELLIENGADVNAKIDHGWTPLYAATYSGYNQVIELLIAKGADVNTKDEDGFTPLGLARSNSEIADLL